MRIIYILPLALLATIATTSTAYASSKISFSIGDNHNDRHHYKHNNRKYDKRHSRGRHNGWNKHYRHGYRNNVVIYRSHPIVRRTYISTNYYVPSYPPNFVYGNLPYREYMTDSGRYCREYQSQAIIAGRPQKTYGHACLQPDGSWEIIN